MTELLKNIELNELITNILSTQHIVFFLVYKFYNCLSAERGYEYCVFEVSMRFLNLHVRFKLVASSRFEPFARFLVNVVFSLVQCKVVEIK